VPLSILLFLLQGSKNLNLKPTMLPPSIDLTTSALAEIPSVNGPFKGVARQYWWENRGVWAGCDKEQGREVLKVLNPQPNTKTRWDCSLES